MRGRERPLMVYIYIVCMVIRLYVSTAVKIHSFCFAGWAGVHFDEAQASEYVVTSQRYRKMNTIRSKDAGVWPLHA